MISLFRREAHHIVAQHQRRIQCACTSYNPKTHSIKGILLPHGVESGWIPIAVPQTNGGAGHFVGPKPGSADKLDGDIFDIDFDGGNPNTPVARAKMSVPQNPPQVQPGEVMTLDEHGSSMYYKQDKSTVFTHGVKGGTSTWAANGDHTADTKGQILNVHSSGGAMNINSGGGMLNIN